MDVHDNTFLHTNSLGSLPANDSEKPLPSPKPLQVAQEARKIPDNSLDSGDLKKFRVNQSIATCLKTTIKKTTDAASNVLSVIMPKKKTKKSSSIKMSLQRFEKLNNLNRRYNIDRNAFSNAKKVEITHGAKAELFLTADYLGKGKLKASTLAHATQTAIDNLKEMDPLNSKLIFALQYASDTYKKLKLSKNNKQSVDKIAKEIGHDLSNLKVGQSIALPSNVRRHAMILAITCTGINSDGKRIYNVTQHNSGKLVDAHHQEYTTDKNKLKFATGRRIEGVSEADLCESTFIKDLLENRTVKEPSEVSVERLYTEILPKLNGKVTHFELPTSKDSPAYRLWSRRQIGGSCAGRGVLSLLKEFCDPKEYREFKKNSRLNLLFNTLSHIQRGGSYFGTNENDRMVAKELLRKLEKSYNGKLPKELQEVKDQLLQIAPTYKMPKELASIMTKLEARKDFTGATEKFELNKVKGQASLEKGQLKSKSVIDNINFAITILREGELSSAAINHALPHIRAVVKMQAASPSSKKLKKEEVSNLKILKEIILKEFENRPLTVEQICVLTALTNTMAWAAPENLEPPSSDNFENFLTKLYRNYTSLNLNSSDDSNEFGDYQKLIRDISLPLPKNED